MPAKAKDAGAEALVAALLNQLEALRRQGGESYPPRLRHLAALTAGATTDEQLVNAVGKKNFTKKAEVTEKVNRKATLDSLIYLKGDAPAQKTATKRAPAKPKGITAKRLPAKPKEDGAELAGRMLLVLEAQRRLGTEAYPPTLGRLAELCGLNASDARVPKAAGHAALTGRAMVAAKDKGKPRLDAPVALMEDVDGDLAVVLPGLLKFALAPASGGGKGKTSESTAFAPSEVGGKLVPELRDRIVSALERGIERRDLPENVAWIVTKGKPLVFLVDHLRRGAARSLRLEIVDAPATPFDDGEADGPTRDFADAFRSAFDQIDRRNGSTNFVKLADLRRSLYEFGRVEFDAGLRTLRLAEEFSLDSHEGLTGSLSAEEREAGVREGGSLLVYVSRR